MSKAYSTIRSIPLYKWVEATALCAVAVHIIVLFFVVVSRINYRYDLEFMEGASLLQVYRIHLGQSLYLQPSLEYTAMIYPPLYFYLAAALVNIMGVSFLPLRLVSFLSTFGCLGVIFCAARNESKSTLMGFVAAGSFLATFKLGGAWFDLARVDMLFLALTLAAIYSLGKQSTATSILAGLLLSLAFLTKQPALPIFAVLAGATWLLFRRQTIPFVGSFVTMSLIAYVALNSATAGWSQYYIFTLPASHQIQWSAAVKTLPSDFKWVALMVLVSLAPLVLGYRAVMKDKSHTYYYVAVVGLGGTSVLARLNAGGYLNTLIPAYAGLSILFGIGIGWLLKRDRYSKINGNLIQTILWLCVLAQFVGLAYNPIAQIPTAADRRVGDALVAELQQAPGDVLIPFHNYLALFAGKRTYFHIIAYYEMRGDFSRSQSPEFWRVVRQFRLLSPSLLIMDWPDQVIREHDCYDTQRIEYESVSTFLPVTGTSLRPTIQYVKDTSCE